MGRIKYQVRIEDMQQIRDILSAKKETQIDGFESRLLELINSIDTQKERSKLSCVINDIPRATKVLDHHSSKPDEKKISDDPSRERKQASTTFLEKYGEKPIGNLHQGLAACFKAQKKDDPNFIFNFSIISNKNYYMLKHDDKDGIDISYEAETLNAHLTIKYTQKLKFHVCMSDDSRLYHIISDKEYTQNTATEESNLSTIYKDIRDESTRLGLTHKAPLEATLSHWVSEKEGNKFTFGLFMDIDYDSRVRSAFINNLSTAEIIYLRHLGIHVEKKYSSKFYNVLQWIKESFFNILFMINKVMRKFSGKASFFERRNQANVRQEEHHEISNAPEDVTPNQTEKDYPEQSVPNKKGPGKSS